MSSRASHGRGRPSGRQLPALLRRLPSHHSHFVLVPGENWGDESRWLSRVAQTLAEDRPTVTILINGGEIALRDVQHSVDAHRPVLVLEGSGRAADDLATGVDGGSDDGWTQQLTKSGRLLPVSADDPAALAQGLDELLARPGAATTSVGRLPGDAPEHL